MARVCGNGGLVAFARGEEDENVFNAMNWCGRKVGVKRLGLIPSRRRILDR